MSVAIRRLVLSVALACVAACRGGSSAPASTGPDPDTEPVGGLDARPANQSCVAPDKNPSAGGSVALERVFDGLSFSQPLAMLQAPGDDSRWFVVERAGRVRVFDNDPAVSTFDADLIDISARVDPTGEGGLLGMAFDPDFPAEPYVFLSWTETGTGASPLTSIVARFTVGAGGVVDLGTEREIVRLHQDFTNHDGGNIAFGPDGYLYIGFGDGGNGGDPNSRGQDTTNLLGAMLRLDVGGAAPYAIPPGNPFASEPALCTADPNVSAGKCPEIFAWGLRNPWRFSFDSATGDLWVGDVGQNTREEVDRVELNGNYGWDCREGLIAYSGTRADSCPTVTGLIDPVYDYGRGDGNSITGGYVYRGRALPALAGRYVFGDYGSGRIWRLADDGAGGYVAEQLLQTSPGIASFAQDNDGELYAINIATGSLDRVVDAGSGSANTPVPALLSETDCFVASDPSRPAEGLIPYTVAAPFWSDGAVKERWLAIPDGTALGVTADGDFTFPSGTVLAKHFRLGGRLVETRLFMRHPDGQWAGYSYAWNDQQTDATLVEGGRVATIDGQDWIYPSGGDCLTCHTAAAGFSLGLEAAQLNHDLTYPATGRTANQLATLDEILLFGTPFGDPGLRPALVDPSDTTAPLDARARAYLHTNCAQCHRPGAPTPSSMDLRFGTDLADTNACGIAPQSDYFGMSPPPLIIAPGAPDDSVLVARISVDRADANAMPPLASKLTDAAGIALIRDWIAGLDACQ